MRTCKVCGKEIAYDSPTKFCERCEAMTPEERKKARPERFAWILYASDLLLVLVGVAVAVLPIVLK